jgi:hypothetical protein
LTVSKKNIGALEAVLGEMRRLLGSKLPEYLTQSRQRLIDLILERVRDKQLQLPVPYLSLFDANLSEQDRQCRAAEEVADAINWPAPHTIVEGIKYEYSINDVTLNHLQQESFRKAFRKAYKFDVDDLLRN